MSEVQKAEWLRMEKDRIVKGGRPNRNPKSPAYENRLQVTREIAGATFRQKLGTEASRQYDAVSDREGTQP